MNLSDDQTLSREIMTDLVLKIKTALDEDYIDPKSLAINHHRIRVRGNLNLKGGFSGEYKLADLEADLEFIKNPGLRNRLLGALDLPPYDLDEIMEFIEKMERPRLKANRQRSPGAGEFGEFILAGFTLLEGHPESTGRTVRLFVALCRLMRPTDSRAKAATVSDLLRQAGVTVFKPIDQIRILKELRLLEETEDGFRLLK